MKHEDNLKITGVRPGTPLHDSLARYWYPVAKASRLEDRCTMKIRLLGENFVVARNDDSLIALEELCPHRQCSLTLARVEEQGLRCIYHGWLIGSDGAVKEVPNEKEQGGRESVRIRAPQVREAAGLIWMNLCGDEEERAPFPDFPWMNLPQSQIVIGDAMTSASWVQSLEGAIDSSHSSHLHSDEIVSAKKAETSSTEGVGGSFKISRPSVDKHPRIKLKDTETGFIYCAIRTPLIEPETTAYVRASVFEYPCYVTFPTAAGLGDLQMFVPVDETHTYFVYVRFSTLGELNEADLLAWSGLVEGVNKDEQNRPRVNSLPYWGQNRAAMASGNSYTGIVGVNLQDIVVQESMGPIVDRSKEHLGAGDIAIVHFRRTLLKAASGEGAAQSGYARKANYSGLVARDALIQSSTEWSEIYSPGEVAWKAAA